MKPFQFDGLERNPDAHCVNCVMGEKVFADKIVCIKDPYSVSKHPNGVCSYHPNFWRVVPEKMTESEAIERLKNYA